MYKLLEKRPVPFCNKTHYENCEYFNKDLKLCETDSSIGLCWLYSPYDFIISCEANPPEAKPKA